MNIGNDLDKLFENLPFFIQENLRLHPKKDKLLEIITDLGRRPEARFTTGPEYLSQKIISWQDIDYTTKRISEFSNENRAGFERTLHRISCIRNRQYLINGLTCRIGRAIFGSISLIRDLLRSGESILILGKPGIGKTTIIREISRLLSDQISKRVIIIDTSNEIAGDNDIPHLGIGRARRMQVSKTELQYQIMIEAVENHMPEVIIIDEIGTELDALAARTIAEKGVQLIGTTHGNSLENLIKNPALSGLIGGIKYVTLSDDEAKRRGTQKSILEREAYSAFPIVIEINEHNSWTVYENVENSIDVLLRRNLSTVQIRTLSINKKINIKYQLFKTNNTLLIKNSNNWQVLNRQSQNKLKIFTTKKLLIYSYSVSNNLIREAVYKIGFKPLLTKELKKATIIIGLTKYLKQNYELKKLAKQQNIPIYAINRNSVYQIVKLLQSIVS